MNNIAFIFARGGSKSLPEKNTKLFNGIPLIAHTIKDAKESQLFDDIVVSTDDETIAKISIDFGASVPFIRPKSLADDQSDEWLSWSHAVSEYNKKFSCFISLPCTSPLRNYDDINKMMKYYNDNKFDVVIGITESNHSPYFNMVKRNQDNKIEILFNSAEKIHRRQDAPKCYKITTYAYITSPNYIKKAEHLFSGNVGGYEISKYRSIDIDDDFDFNLASSLLNKNNNE